MRYKLENKNGKLLAVDEMGRRLYSAWMIVTSQYACDKDCPFCTAKITKWPEGSDRWDMMQELLLQLQKNKVVFDHVTVSGNGEPSILPINQLRELANVIKEFPSMWEKRTFQTSGNIFFHHDKWELFQDYIFQITRCAVNSATDMSILKYSRDYAKSELFKQSKITINIPLLKNLDSLQEEVESYAKMFPNLRSLTLKLLNLNTFDDANVSSPPSKWILENALSPAEKEKVVEKISKIWPLVDERDDFFDRYKWKGPVPIKMKAKRSKYGISNVVYFRGNIVDYQLKTRSPEEVGGFIGEIPQEMEDYHIDKLRGC